MNLDAVAKRVSSLPPRLLDVLACLSEGMSNSQIAAELGYKNARSVATLTHDITKRLGLLDVHSRIEKRQLAAEAFRKATLRTVKIELNKISLPTLESLCGERMRTLARQGYQVQTVEVVFRKAVPIDRLGD
jgi:DNA-binding NarL/FixJ family response regulator